MDEPKYVIRQGTFNYKVMDKTTNRIIHLFRKDKEGYEKCVKCYKDLNNITSMEVVLL